MQAGTSLGPYEVVALLGVGGMGEVWRARRPGTVDPEAAAIPIAPLHPH